MKNTRIFVLCAGEGKRLRPYTEDKPKCMVPYKNKPLLQYQLEVFEKFHLNDITLIGGYHSEALPKDLYPVVVNHDFSTTNMLFSLFCAESDMPEDRDMIMDKVKTDDAIPYWDYDAPVTPETPRDASAAAVTASGMLELSTMVSDGQKYFDYAESILKTLSSDAYLAGKGKNGFFILMHSTGSLPHGSEIDAPLNYADYYYLEALRKYLKNK